MIYICQGAHVLRKMEGSIKAHRRTWSLRPHTSLPMEPVELVEVVTGLDPRIVWVHGARKDNGCISIEQGSAWSSAEQGTLLDLWARLPDGVRAHLNVSDPFDVVSETQPLASPVSSRVAVSDVLI